MRFIYLFFALIFGANISTFAGNSSPIIDSSEYVLQFTHSIRGKQKILRVGERVKIRVRNESGLSRGKIVAITDSSLSLYRAGKIKKIALTDIDLIQKTTIGNIFATAGGLYIGIDGIAVVAGSIDLLNNISPSNSWAGLEVIIIGILFIIGLGFIFTGTLPFWARAKRFNLANQRWQMQARRVYRDKRGRIKTIE